MNQHVALEVTLLCGGEITLCANKWLLTAMNQYMAFQIARLFACIISQAATVWHLSLVQSLLVMFCKIFRLHFHTVSSQNSFDWCHARLKDNWEQIYFANSRILGKWKFLHHKIVGAAWIKPTLRGQIKYWGGPHQLAVLGNASFFRDDNIIPLKKGIQTIQASVPSQNGLCHMYKKHYLTIA